MKTSSHSFLRILPLLAASLALALPAPCQQPDLPDAPQPQNADPDAATIRNTPRNILKDQEAIWTSPIHLNGTNAFGPVVLVLATTVLITTDHEVMSQHLLDKSMNDDASKASNGLTGLFIAAPAVLFAAGKLRHGDQAVETGILGGEAMLDSLAVNYAMKAITMRERPTVNGAHGQFFQTHVGLDSSFPSNHAVLAWSSAAVIASEYPGFLTQLTAYTLATGVSVTRIAARQHFPSDVLVGSAVGWMIGRYVYHRHTRDQSASD